MLDIAISVITALLTLGLGYMGIHVTLHPATTHHEKTRYKRAFAAGAFFMCCLIIVQSVRSKSSQDSVSYALGTIENNTKTPPQVNNYMPQPKVIINSPPVALPSHKQVFQSPGIQLMTSAQLRDRVLSFARKMRDHDAQQVEDDRDFIQKREEAINRQPNLTAEQKKEEINSPTKFRMEQKRAEQFAREFGQDWYGQATEYRDEMIRRLGPQDPISLIQQMQMIWGTADFPNPPATPENCDATADYLEKLARSLPK